MACGADLKGAFALAKGNDAFLVDGFGDLSDIDNFIRYERAVKYYGKSLGVSPKAIACDLHPSYFSTSFAGGFASRVKGSRLVEIQHHEAHIASAIADNSIKGGVIGVAFDGTGFGSDGNIWGGEFFAGNIENLRRVARLEYIAMPGGEAAVREPWRMAASFLYSAFGGDFLNLDIDFVKNLDKKKWRVLKDMIDKKINSPLTSSVGRLFDAVGSLILLKGKIQKEAEIPIEMEKIAPNFCEDVYGFDNSQKGEISAIDASCVIRGVVKDLSKGIEKGVISAKFHN